MRGDAAMVSMVLVGTLVLGGCSGVGSTFDPSTPEPLSDGACSSGTGSAAGAPTLAAGVSAIVAHGTCRVVGPGPDSVNLTVVVRVPAPAARAALDGTVTTATAVLAALKRRGVAPSDIRDGLLQVNPVLNPILSSSTGVGGTRAAGFEGTKSFTATLRDTTAAGGIIASVVDATGPNGQVQVAYNVDDPTLRARARSAAVRQALDKARQMADAAGVTLGQLISLTDVPPARPIPASSTDQATTAASAFTAADDSRGTDVSVDVVYAVG